MKTLTILTLVFVMFGCADTSKMIRNETYKGFSISKDSSVYVAVPKDGRYGDNNYGGSGQTVTSIISSAFTVHLNQVTDGIETENYRNALDTAQNNDYKYLIFPTILHWEDRATEWSGIPDKVSLKIIVVDTTTEKTVSSANIEGASGIATFGGDHPQDLLPKPIAKYVNSIIK